MKTTFRWLWNEYKGYSLEELVFELLSDFQKRKEKVSQRMPFLIVVTMRIWVLIVYYFYFFFPLSLFKVFLNYWVVALNIVLRRSFHAKRIYLHICALVGVLCNGFTKLLGMKLEDIAKNLFQTTSEVSPFLLSLSFVFLIDVYSHFFFTFE